MLSYQELKEKAMESDNEDRRPFLIELYFRLSTTNECIRDGIITEDEILKSLNEKSITKIQEEIKSFEYLESFRD
jgi:hypothetical protein